VEDEVRGHDDFTYSRRYETAFFQEASHGGFDESRESRHRGEDISLRRSFQHWNLGDVILYEQRGRLLVNGESEKDRVTRGRRGPWFLRHTVELDGDPRRFEDFRHPTRRQQRVAGS